MAALRYPSTIESNSPFVLFTTHKPQYNGTGNEVQTLLSGNSVALYIPQGVTVSDSLRWEGAATGAVGTAFEQISNGTFDAKEALQAVAMDNATALGATVAGTIGNKIGSTIGAAVGGGGAAGVIGNVKSEYLKTYQRTLNPREFMLFKAPSMRSFAFNFVFVPRNENEAKAVPEIIKFFRKASYPLIHSGGYDYTFPDAFNIRFQGSDNIIKIPEVVCQSVSTVYNPNSISYFVQDGQPVEINLSLQFVELKPIDRSMIDKGY